MTPRITALLQWVSRKLKTRLQNSRNFSGRVRAGCRHARGVGGGECGKAVLNEALLHCQRCNVLTGCIPNPTQNTGCRC
jgi:hypothetical protein